MELEISLEKLIAPKNHYFSFAFRVRDLVSKILVSNNFSPPRNISRNRDEIDN